MSRRGPFDWQGSEMTYRGFDWHKASVSELQGGKIGKLVEVTLTGAAVTIEAAPRKVRKARAVVVKCIVLVV